MSPPGKGTLPECRARAEIAWTMGAIGFQFAVCAFGLRSDGRWPLGQAFLKAQRPTFVTRGERSSSPSSRPAAVLIWFVVAYTAPAFAGFEPHGRDFAVRRNQRAVRDESAGWGTTR